MQLSAASASSTTPAAPATTDRPAARYGGTLHVRFPQDHWTHAPDPEGPHDALAVPMVITGPAIRTRFTSLQDAIVAAQHVSRGDRDAVAVVRAPGSGSDGPWFVDNLLVNDFFREHRWAPVDLEGVVTPQPSGTDSIDVFQTLGSQQKVIVGAIVDGDLVLDRIERYKSTRPDLPGRDPDSPRGSSGSRSGTR